MRFFKCRQCGSFDTKNRIVTTKKKESRFFSCRNCGRKAEYEKIDGAWNLVFETIGNKL